ncbi:HTH domain-containing protein [Sporosarcina phage Lietuvens]|nr:HTH domain-containing protein [Sporosarcina phage Lietuvens]
MLDKRTVVDFRKRRFIQVTRDVIHNTDKLTKPVEIAVYAVLCMYADNDDKTSHPSVATIAEKSRCSERVVHRALTALKEAGYIGIVNRTDRNGFKTSNQYVLLDVVDGS